MDKFLGKKQAFLFNLHEPIIFLELPISEIQRDLDNFYKKAIKKCLKLRSDQGLPVAKACKVFATVF